LTLAASTMGSIGGSVTLTPPSSTEVAYVAAKQSFGAGPTVTIKYQEPDLVTGAYTIAKLPVTAPQYVLYSSARPLVFAAAVGVSGGRRLCGQGCRCRQHRGPEPDGGELHAGAVSTAGRSTGRRPRAYKLKKIMAETRRQRKSRKPSTTG